MPKALYGFAVPSHEIEGFRKSVTPLDEDALEGAGLRRADIYLDAQAAFLLLESEEGAPLGALQKTERGTKLLDSVTENSWFDMMKVKDLEFEEVRAWGEGASPGPGAPVQFLKCVADADDAGEVHEALTSLPDDLHDLVGASGLELWRRGTTFVLRADAPDLAWLTTEVDALEGGSLFDLLFRLTDLNPRDRGRVLLRALGESSDVGATGVEAA